MLGQTRSLLMKTLVLLGLGSVAAFPHFASSRAAVAQGAPTFLMITVAGQVPPSNSVIIINQANGTVTQCSGLFNITLQQPVGSCSPRGKVTPPSGNSSLITAVEGSFIFILNSNTGTLFRCLVSTDTQSNPTGSCAIAMQKVP